MSWPLTHLEAGERYATAQDLAVAEQLGRMPVRVIGATFPDGKPLKIVLRALTAREQAACLKAARTRNGDIDEWTFAVEAVFRGMDEPRLTDSQKSILWDMNGAIINDLASLIERISALPAYAIRQEVEAMAHVSVPADPKTHADDDSRVDDARDVSVDSRAPVGSPARGT